MLGQGVDHRRRRRPDEQSVGGLRAASEVGKARPAFGRWPP